MSKEFSVCFKSEELKVLRSLWNRVIGCRRPRWKLEKPQIYLRIRDYRALFGRNHEFRTTESTPTDRKRFTFDFLRSSSKWLFWYYFELTSFAVTLIGYVILSMHSEPQPFQIKSSYKIWFTLLIINNSVI